MGPVAILAQMRAGARVQVGHYKLNLPGQDRLTLFPEILTVTATDRFGRTFDLFYLEERGLRGLLGCVQDFVINLHEGEPNLRRSYFVMTYCPGCEADASVGIDICSVCMGFDDW